MIKKMIIPPKILTKHRIDRQITYEKGKTAERW